MLEEILKKREYPEILVMNDGTEVSKENWMDRRRELICLLEEHSYVALVDDKPVGFVINKIWLHNYPIEQYLNTGWISLIYVKKEFRNMGIGSELLSKLFSWTSS